jgi:hypothetical protein
VECPGNPHHGLDGLGCRAAAAEIIPMEPVWVLSRRFSATLSTLSTLATARVLHSSTLFVLP